MSAHTVLRPALPRDSEGIARVHVETWQSAYAGLVPAAYLTRMSVPRSSAQWRRTAARAGRGSRLLVAEAGSEVNGFVCFGPARDSKMAFGGEVYALYVAIDWQGQGIGRRLMAAALGSLAQAGHSDALVWVLAANPSRFFYEAMGGRPVGERVERFAGAGLEERAYGWPDLDPWRIHHCP